MGEFICKQRLVLTERKNLEIEGVEGILAFDENYISLATSEGKLNIEGKELKVDNLSKNDGKIHIVGSINSIYFFDDAKKSYISRLFK